MIGVTDSTGRPGPLLIVVEPARDGEMSSVGAVLAAEGARIAGKLGVEMRLVTWEVAPAASPAAIAAALAAAARKTRPVAMLVADTDVGRQLAPMVAHSLGSGAVVGCSDVLVHKGMPVFVKPVYGEWLEHEIVPAAGAIPVGALDVGGLAEREAASTDSLRPEKLPVVAGGKQPVRSLETIAPDARTVDLVHAKRIVTAGAGSASEALLAAARELADLLQGSVGATRPVVDDGRLPKERLIGQTGRTVNPELYLALGLSGSPHHVAGVKKAHKILSINRDLRAPIFDFSDVGYVADLEDVLPALVRKIKEYRDATGSAE